MAQHGGLVVVDDQVQPVQPVLRGQHHGLPHGAFVHFTITGHHKHAALAGFGAQGHGHAGGHAQAMPQRPVDGFIARNDRIGDPAQNPAGLADAVQFLLREKAQIGQNGIHANRAVPFGNHAAVTRLTQRPGSIKFQHAAVIERDKQIDRRQRRGNARFGNAAVNGEGFTPDPFGPCHQIRLRGAAHALPPW